MADGIILLVVVVILVFAVKGSIKHLRGESPCCGGGSSELPPEEKKLDGPVLGKKTIQIRGMSCEHCVNRVTKALNQVEGAAAKVSLRGKKAVVSYDREIDDAALRKAVEDAGYEVVSIA
ncbi:MAG: heavy-metal-associated domain-containing protein [Clostridiales bacterium]|nr:heavy-metal-associated domain-containing protein [Clostridiales bacterium]MCD8369882.1 heavy-metal-associated domain-containing protein [Clostridiales bacterium]